MFWKLEGQSSGRLIYFEGEPKGALKKMHNAKLEHREEFKLHGRNADAEVLYEISNTEIYPEVIVYGEKQNRPARNTRRVERRVSKARGKD